MANTSIKAAFEQFWKHVIARTGDIISTANAYSDTKLGEAKSYTDTLVSGFASKTDITSGIDNHNSSTSAHSDIRTSISNLSSAVDGALPKAGGTMTGIIDMAWNRITNVPTPVADADAVGKSYVDGKRKTYTTTLSTNWASDGSYYQTVTVNGILATDMPHITLETADDLATAKKQRESWNMVSEAYVEEANKITFICYNSKPTVALSLQIEVMR